jgi:hypothetical protein
VFDGTNGSMQTIMPPNWDGQRRDYLLSYPDKHFVAFEPAPSPPAPKQNLKEAPLGAIIELY